MMMTTTRIKQTATVMATRGRIAALAKIEQCRTDRDTIYVDVAGVNAAVYQLVEYDGQSSIKDYFCHSQDEIR